LVLLAPALALTRCLFPSLDGLTSDASVIDAGSDVSDATPPIDAVAPDVDAGLGSYTSEVMADSPASWWRLGETSTSAQAVDEMKVQNGTFQLPGVTLGVLGAIAKDPNTAMSLDGTNGALVLPGSLYDLGGTVPFAIEVWLSPGAPPPLDAGDPDRRVVSHRTDSPYFGWYMEIDPNQRLVFTRWDQDTQLDQLISKPLVQDKYSHVVVSADGASMSLYVNGVLVAATPQSAITPNVAANAFAWGSLSDLDGEFLNGSLDEPAIYTHALAPSRVLAHYQAGIGN